MYTLYYIKNKKKNFYCYYFNFENIDNFLSIFMHHRKFHFIKTFLLFSYQKIVFRISHSKKLFLFLSLSSGPVTVYQQTIKQNKKITKLCTLPLKSMKTIKLWKEVIINRRRKRKKLTTRKQTYHNYLYIQSANSHNVIFRSNVKRRALIKENSGVPSMENISWKA